MSNTKTRGRPLFTDEQAGDLASDSLGFDRTYAHLLWSGERKQDAMSASELAAGVLHDRERERAPEDMPRISRADYRRWTTLEAENTQLLADKSALDTSNTTLRLQLAEVEVINDRLTTDNIEQMAENRKLATRNELLADHLADCGQWAVKAKRRLAAAEAKVVKLVDVLGKVREHTDDIVSADPVFEEKLSGELGRALRHVDALRSTHATVVEALQNCIANVVGHTVKLPSEEGELASPGGLAPPSPPTPAVDVDAAGDDEVAPASAKDEAE